MTAHGQPRDPVMILAPPRSFTSVIAAMLGQHPQLYGMPELNLPVADTMRERTVVLSKRRFAEHGLLRAVAQLFTGQQTFQTILLAEEWLAARQNTLCMTIFRELSALVAPRRIVEKSPLNCWLPGYLHRLQRAMPDARYIHLLRNPKTQGASVDKNWRNAAAVSLDAFDYSTNPPTIDFQKPWFGIHLNILNFLKGVPAWQQIRLRGEDLLRQPDQQLTRIAAWLGISQDQRAIEAMKHPEASPFGFLGPINALFGNDPEFLRSPMLRTSKAPRDTALEGPVPWRNDGKGLSPDVTQLARQFGYE